MDRQHAMPNLEPSTPIASTGTAQSGKLVPVKTAHTLAWAFFFGCIVAIPVALLIEQHAAAAWFSALVLIEVAILLLNGWRCPLTSLAARFTEDPQAIFDIHLPLWLARHNKLILGLLYVLGMIFAYVR